MTNGANNETAGVSRMLRGLAHRNFRLFFAGQGISLIGTWMTRIATSWLVFRLSDPAQAPFMLGVVGFAGQIPAFFLSPVAGVLVDRWNRHRLLVVTQLLSMIQSFLLAAVAFSHQPGADKIWELIVLSVFQGLINAFDMPGRQAFLVEMVSGKESLANAIALNSSLFNGARLIGPSLAGALIAVVREEGWCFLVDGFSYMAVIAALLAMNVTPRLTVPAKKQVWHGLAEGFGYAFGFAPIRSILLLVATVSFMGMSYTTLLPVFARDILQGDAGTYGFLMTASGVGALAGALYLAWRPTVVGLGRVIVVATVVFGVSTIGFAYSANLGTSLFLSLWTGFGMMVQMASSNTVLQTIVDEDKRGRVMSLYTMAFMGLAPFGSLFAGGIARISSPAATLTITGTACALAGILFAFKLPSLRELIRPIYRRMGILPELATGIQAATELRTPPEQ